MMTAADLTRIHEGQPSFIKVVSELAGFAAGAAQEHARVSTRHKVLEDIAQACTFLVSMPEAKAAMAHYAVYQVLDSMLREAGFLPPT